MRDVAGAFLPAPFFQPWLSFGKSTTCTTSRSSSSSTGARSIISGMWGYMHAFNLVEFLRVPYSYSSRYLFYGYWLHVRVIMGLLFCWPLFVIHITAPAWGFLLLGMSGPEYGIYSSPLERLRLWYPSGGASIFHFIDRFRYCLAFSIDACFKNY